MEQRSQNNDYPPSARERSPSLEHQYLDAVGGQVPRFVNLSRKAHREMPPEVTQPHQDPRPPSAERFQTKQNKPTTSNFDGQTQPMQMNSHTGDPTSNTQVFTPQPTSSTTDTVPYVMSDSAESQLPRPASFDAVGEQTNIIPQAFEAQAPQIGYISRSPVESMVGHHQQPEYAVLEGTHGGWASNQQNFMPAGIARPRPVSADAHIVRAQAINADAFNTMIASQQLQQHQMQEHWAQPSAIQFAGGYMTGFQPQPPQNHQAEHQELT